MAYGLDGLLLNAVVDADDEHDDVGDGRSARAHRFERVVPRRVDERYAAATGALQTYYSRRQTSDMPSLSMLKDSAFSLNK